jgi:probable phosphomutase (TIGR03848 family)
VTTLLFIRHGAHTLGADRIPGRMRGVHLSPLGRDQVARLADRLAGLTISAVYSSPLERTLETADPIAERLGLHVQTSPAINEVDYGEWTGMEFDALGLRQDWNRWNTFRSGSRAPGGESMLEVQVRAVSEAMRLTREHQGQLVAVVSHGDVIRAAMLYLLGMPLDLLARLEISLASVSIVQMREFGPLVTCVNSTGNLEG